MAVHRNRVIYQSEALFVSPDSTGYHFTGAYGGVEDSNGVTHTANFGLMTPPTSADQVMGVKDGANATNEAGQAVGWQCGEAWPVWNADNSTGGKTARSATGDQDGGTADIVLTLDNIGRTAQTTYATDGGKAVSDSGGDVANTLGNQLVGDVTADKPDLVLNGGVDFDKAAFTLGGGNAPAGAILNDASDGTEASGEANGLQFAAVTELANKADGDAFQVAITVDTTGGPTDITFANGKLTITIDQENPTATQIFNLFTATFPGGIAIAAGDPGTVAIQGLVNVGDEVTAAVNGQTVELGPISAMDNPGGSAPATAATLTIPGVALEVSAGTAVIEAVAPGAAWNTKFIQGNDADTLDQLVADYNSDNPKQMIKVVSGGSEVLDASTRGRLTLTGGENGDAKAHGTIIQQLNRVQSANYGFTVNRQDINQFGHASRIDSIVVESPTVNLDFSYYLLDGKNERLLEFVTDGDTNTLSGLLTPELYQAGNNFFILTAPEARDAVVGDVALNKAGKETDKSVIALGNGYITDYSVDISVGSIPTASVTVEGMNIRSDFGTTGNDVPAVDMKNGSRISEAWAKDAEGALQKGVCNPGGCTGLYSLPAAVSGYTGCATDGSLGSIAALRPGDVLVDLSSKSLLSKSVAGNSDTPVIGSAHVQSASISLPLGRTTLQRLGSVFGFSKAIDLPLSVSMSFNALVADMKEGDMMDLLCDCSEFDVGITIFKPECAGCTVKDLSDPDNIAMRYTMKGARLESENFSSTIGDNKSVDLTFTTQIGSSDDMKNGLYMLGSESRLSANGGLPPAWTGVGGTTMEAVDGYLFGYRA